jgi:threonine aldolase
MAAAEVGDDVYGEDPTVNALQAEVAEMLGQEAGLFMPTGSLSNLIGVRLLVPPGKELLCDAAAHVVRAEMGAHGALAGITTRTWPSARGELDLDVVRAMAAPDAGPYLVSTAAISVEDTHNFGGGTVVELAAMRQLRAFADDKGLGLHLDGARVWNAHIATGVELSQIGGLFDTVSVCLSKGLGAPVGSVLLSSRDRIAAARVWRKRHGAGMRQVGVLAAAGRFALAHNLRRLADDHSRAHELAAILAAARPDVVNPADVATNIAVLDLSSGPGAAELAAAARDQGVLISVLGPRTARLVTHLDINDSDVERAGVVLVSLLGG